MNSPEVAAGEVKTPVEYFSQRVASLMEEQIQEKHGDGEQKHLKRVGANRTPPRIPGLASY